jgi:hypothetical protein
MPISHTLKRKRGPIMGGASDSGEFEDDYDQDDSMVFEPGDGLAFMYITALVIVVVALIFVVCLIVSALR